MATKTLTIREMPEDVLGVLKARAAQAGQSLQAYTRDLLVGQATTPTLAEVTARAEAEANASFTAEDVLDAIDEGRTGW